MTLSTKLPWTQANTQWASQLNPLLANPLNNVSILQDIALVDGVNVISHYLGRTQQGWFIVDIQGADPSLYRSAPFNNLTLTLTCAEACTVSLAVF